MKIYVAGKNIERAQKVMDSLRNEGHLVTFDWIENLDRGSLRQIAIDEAEAVRVADLLVYLWEDDQESARYEAGMAMGLQKPIVASGKSDVFFFQLPNVYCVESDDEIIKKINEVT